ncbi:MAG: hypothetical protein AAB512_00515 [Patescibacteria group bacterium]
MEDDDGNNKWILAIPLWVIAGLLFAILMTLVNMNGIIKEVYSDTHWMTGVMEKTHDNVEYIYNILEKAN